MLAIRHRSITACGSRSTPRMTARPSGSRESSTCRTAARGYPSVFFPFRLRRTRRRARLGWLCLSVRRYMTWMTRLKSAFFMSKQPNTMRKRLTVCRKYRVLDDCARLRDVIDTFPEDRHFIPSILFVLWGQDASEPLPDDLHLMVRFLVWLCLGLL